MKNNIQKIISVLLVISLVAFCFLFLSFYKKINDNNDKAELDIATWQTEALRRDDIKSLNRALKKIEPDRLQLETHFAKSSDVVPFLDTIEKLAPPVGAKAEVSSVDTKANNTGLIVGLKASGSFEAIYKFLTLLENSPYELDFLSIDIHNVAPNVADKNIKSSSWEAVFKIQLLSFVQ